MKLLTDFEAFSSITSNSVDPNFPLSNLVDTDPFMRWHANQFSFDEWITIYFGTATVIDTVFLNQCNFAQAVIQGNTSDAWSTPAFSQSIELVKDDADNRKGCFSLVGFNYAYMRIKITTGQTLDNSETAPAIGNLIMGVGVELPIVNSFEPVLVKLFDEFKNDNGSFSQIPKDGRAFHSISVTCRDSLAAIRSLPRNWLIGVFFADLGYADEAYLVYPPREWKPPVRNVLDTELSFTLMERP